MLAFVRILCLVGLPVFAIAAFLIWKPVDSDKGAVTSLVNRIAWTIFALAASPLLCFPVIFLPIVLILIWKPARRISGTTADRIAWTIFAFGICLMLTMVLFTMTQEGDGDFRTWETIRLHSRVLLAISIIPILGPLVVFLVQAVRAHRGTAVAKKAPVDDWDVEPPLR